MITIDGKEFRNLQEQVGKNKADIDEIKQSLGSALPDPIPGPQGEPGASIIGPQGPRGEKGERGYKGDQGPMGAGWTSITEIDSTNYTPTVVEDSDSFVDYTTDIDIKCDGNTHTATLKLELPKTGSGGDVTDVEVNGTSVVDSDGVADITISTVGISGDYDDLTNKPTIPTKTSDLNNDSGFITSADIPAQVQSNWNESDNTSPAYIQNKPSIPSANDFVKKSDSSVQTIENTDDQSSVVLKLKSGVSNAKLEFIDNSNNSIGTITASPTNGLMYQKQGLGNYRVAMANELATVATSGDYNDLLNKPTIPTKTSDLSNDSGFVSNTDVVLKETNTKQTIQSTLGSGVNTPIALKVNSTLADKVLIEFVNNNTVRGAIGYDTDNQLISRQGGADQPIALKSDIVQADWSVINPYLPDYIKNKPNLATVATTGSYTDLSNTPSIPTKVSDLANDSGFISEDSADAKYNKIKGHLTTATLPADPDKGDIWIADDELTIPVGGGSGTLNAFEVSDIFQDGDYVFFDNTISDADMLTFLQGLTYVDGTCDLVTAEDDQQQTKGLVTAINMNISEDPEDPQYIYALGCYSNTNGSVAWVSDGSAMGLDDGWQPLTAEGGFLLDYPDGETYMAVTSLNATAGWNGVICGTKESATITLHTGDWLYYDGTNWLKTDNQEYASISSVNTLGLQVANNSNAIVDIKDNMYGINLLDNSNFKVNQLGKASYLISSALTLGSKISTVDRWRIGKPNNSMGKGITLNINDNSIELVMSTTTRFYQVINNDVMKQLEGKYLRFSMNIDGTILTGTFDNAITNAAYTKSTITLDAATGLTVALEKVADSYFTLSLYNDSDSAQTYSNIYWVKLEVENSGIGRTPYVMPDPILELQKCQAYQQILMDGGLSALDIGFLIATNNFRVVYKPIVEFVSIPTLVTGTVNQKEVAYTTNSIVTLSAFALNQYTTKRTILFDCTPSSTAVAAGTPGFLRSKSSDTTTAYLYVNFDEALPG